MDSADICLAKVTVSVSLARPHRSWVSLIGSFLKDKRNKLHLQQKDPESASTLRSVGSNDWSSESKSRGGNEIKTRTPSLDHLDFEKFLSLPLCVMANVSYVPLLHSPLLPHKPLSVHGRRASSFGWKILLRYLELA